MVEYWLTNFPQHGKVRDSIFEGNTVDNEIVAFFLKHLDILGFPGVVIGMLVVAICRLWGELKAERARSEVLVEKMNVMSRETVIMIERIIGSK